MIRRSERGLALVVVLLGVAALSLIAFAMLSSSLTASRIARNDWAQLQIATAADSAVQAAILSLFDPLPKEQPPLDGTPRDSAAGDIDITTAIQDEAGRLDLNLSGREILRSYFAAAGGLDTSVADALAANVIAWRTAHGPFQSTDELRGVPGMTPDLVARLAPGVTVYSHRASFDMRTAPPTVLQAIPGMSKANADATATARGRAIVRPGHAYRIQVSAVRGGMHVTREAVVLVTGNPASPYWMLDWR
jgi:general secretion pathway protein K